MNAADGLVLGFQLGLAVGVIGATCYFLSKLNKEQKIRTEKTDVLFFPESDCEDDDRPIYRRQRGRNLLYLLETLSSAKQSIDVCVFTISCSDLVEVLIDAHCRGVVVRVITDIEMEGASGSEVEGLRRAGVEVRTDFTSYFMHHKFALVDGRQVVTGSLNWTVKGLYGNQENVVVSSNRSLVEPFSQHFQLLWDHYHPSNAFPAY